MLIDADTKALLHGALSLGSDTDVEVRTTTDHVDDVQAIYSFFTGCFFTFHTYIITEIAFLVNQQNALS